MAQLRFIGLAEVPSIIKELRASTEDVLYIGSENDPETVAVMNRDSAEILIKAGSGVYHAFNVSKMDDDVNYCVSAQSPSCAVDLDAFENHLKGKLVGEMSVENARKLIPAFEYYSKSGNDIGMCNLF